MDHQSAVVSRHAHPGASFRALPLAVLLLAGGCATLYEGKYAFGDGWREARVTQVAEGRSLSRGATFDCRKRSPVKDGEFFARVEYSFSARVKLTYIVPVRDASAIQANDLVYAKVGDCGVALVPRRPPSS